ncbi:MAG: outer membrane protein transport protein [Mariprofundaceae bacterium]|nr:outer membrane protein transport protein [Mariprofundaceae bacterium]
MKGGWNLMRKILLLLCCFTWNQAGAAGFANEDLTASGAGVANAVVASADDVSAAMYNPAGLAWQGGLQILLGNQSRYRTAGVDVNGSSSSADVGLADVGLFALSWMPEGSDWGVSGAIVVPFSSRLDWNDAFLTSPQQLGGMDMEMKRYSLDSIWRIHSGLAVSLGVDSYDSRVLLNQNASTFSGSGTGAIGLHAGMRWQAQPFWMLGAFLRQGATLDITAGNNVLSIQLPDELSLAVAHDVDDLLRVELDIKHTRWSAMSDWNVTGSALSLGLDLQDTTDVLLGATWYWRDNTQLRLGYAYEQAANVADALQPALLDLTGHRFSAGFGGMMSGMHLDVAYSWVTYTDTDVTGTWAGSYQDAQQSFLFSLSKSF